MAHRKLSAIPFALVALAAVGCRSEPRTDITTTTGATVERIDADVTPSSVGGDMSAGASPADTAGSATTRYSPVAPAQPNVASDTAVPGVPPPSQMTSGGSAMRSDAGAPRWSQPATNDPSSQGTRLPEPVAPASSVQGSSFGNYNTAPPP